MYSARRIYDTICRRCGKKFKTKKWTRRYCSACTEIRKEEALEFKKHRKYRSKPKKDRYKDRDKPTFPDRPCVICGNLYTPTGSTQLYCPVCKKTKVKEWNKAKGQRRKLHPEYRKWHREYEKARRKTNTDMVREEFGDRCMICGKKLSFEPKRKRAAWACHHVSYEPEIKILVCVPCHMWLHGQMRVYKHPIKEKYKPDIAPYIFSKKVVELYEKYNPSITEEFDEKFK